MVRYLKRVLGVLACATLILSVSDSGASRTRSRGRRATQFKNLSAAEVAAILSPGFTNTAFRGDDCTAEAFASGPYSFCGSGTSWTCDQSSGDMVAGQMDGLADEGVRSSATTNGWSGTAQIPAIADDADYHFRFLFKWTTFSDEIFRWDGPGSNEFRFYMSSNGNMTIRANMGSSLYSINQSISAYTSDDAILVDLVYDANDGGVGCGGGGCPDWKIYMNNVEHAAASHTVNHTGTAGGGTSYVLTGPTCPNTGARGITLFYLNSGPGFFTFAQHQSDFSSLGL